MSIDSSSAAKPSRVPVICTLIGLVILLAFVGRVLYFMNAIRHGDIDPTALSFTKEYTALKRLPAVQPGAHAAVARADAYAIGPASAPLQIVEFADFGCPFSKETADTVRVLANTYNDRVRISFRHLPLTDLHPGADQAAQAAECAGDQGKFWEYHDKLFQNQQDLSEAALTRYAKELNVDDRSFSTCLSSGKYVARVQQDLEAGLSLGVGGTPTFFFNGLAIPGAIPATVFEQLIKTLATPS